MTLTNTKSDYIKVRWLLLYLIPVLISLSFTTRFFEINSRTPNYTHIIYILFSIPFCWLVVRKCDENKISLGKIIGEIPKENVWLRLVGITITGMMFMLGSMITVASLMFIGLPNLLTSFSTDQSSNAVSIPVNYSASIILQFFSMAIVAPFIEELLFRGIILNRWIEKWGVTKALIASSLLFGVLHINVIGASMLGLIYGILYLKYQTLWVTFFCHALNNAIIVILIIFSSTKSGSILPEEVDNLKIWSLLFGISLMVVSLLFLWISKLRFPQGYVQPSHRIKSISTSKYKCSSNMYIPRAIVGFVLAIFSGLTIVRSDVYKSIFTAEPYRSLTSANKDKVDSYVKRLTELIESNDIKSIEHRKKSSVNALLLLVNIYEEESRSTRDFSKAKLAAQKSQKIKEIATNIANGKVSLNSKIIKEIN
jgi:uncharacterized protein